MCSAPSKIYLFCADIDSAIALDQGSPNYDPRAKSGLRRHFIRSAKNFVNNEKIIYLPRISWFSKI